MKYILGSGISALTFALFNPDYEIITKKFEIPNSDSFNLSVKVQATKENAMLLNLLGIKAATKEIPIKYNFNGINKDFLNFDEKQKLQNLKLRTLKTDSTHSSGKNIFIGEEVKKNEKHTERVFDVKMSEVISKLYESCKDRVITRDIKRITSSRIYFEDEEIPFLKIVSTLPAPVFWKLWSFGDALPQIVEKPTFKFNPIYDAVFSSAPKNIIDQSLTYWITDKYIRTISDGTKVLIEGNSQEDIANFVAENNISGCISTQTMPYSRISYSQDNIPPAQSIRFLGRFAEWNSDIRLDRIIAKCTTQLAIENIWEEQRNFQSNIINFSELNSIKEKQKLTKEYILHLYSQTDQLLNAINWKFYKEDQPIDYNDVSMQLVDIFKYWLAICIIWGITPDEFIKTFDAKSKIVRNRLEKGEYK